MSYVKKFTGPRNRKRASKAKKALQSRYGSSFKTAKFDRMAKDIMSLKSIINSEKKNFSVVGYSAAIGQVNGNNEGAYTIDITPNPAQGVTDSTRVGDSLKLHSAVADFQFRQMTGASSAISVTIEMWYVLGMPQATSTFLEQLLRPTPFLVGANIRDSNAHFDQDYRQQYKLVTRRKVLVKADTATEVKNIKNVKIPLRFGNLGHHVKFLENTSVVASGQIMLLIRADNGNISQTTASTIGNCPNPVVNTGLQMNRSMTYYYYDN